MRRILVVVPVLVLAVGCKKSAEHKSAPTAIGSGERDDDKKPREVGGEGGLEPKLKNGQDAGVTMPDPGLPGGLVVTPADGEMIATGAIDKDVVRRVVKTNLQKLQLCYEQALLANPGIEGRVVVSFTLEIDGGVTEVKAAGIHRDVEACVADKFRAFKFPAPTAKVAVEYPFTFRPA